MKKFERFVTSSEFLLLFLYASGFAVLSFGVKTGEKIIIGLIGLSLVLLVTKLFLITKRKRKRITKGIVVVLFFSGLIIYTLFLGFINKELSVSFVESEPNIVDKVQLITSKVKQAPQHRDMLQTEENGVKFFYEKGQEGDVQRTAELITAKEKIWDELMGETNQTLAIQFVDDSYIKKGIGEREGARGAFYSKNNTIYLSSKDEELEYILHHEYVHFRINAYKPEENGKEKRIPQWFNEGLADSAALNIDLGFLRLAELEQKVPFSELNSNEAFHQKRKQGIDTYQQSFTMVRKLINDYSWGEVVELAKAENQEQFYSKLEKLTGKNIEMLEEELK